MATNTVYTIIGGNKGLGLGLVATYLARPSTTVIATVRSTTAATALQSAAGKIVKGANSKLYIAQIDLSNLGTPESIRTQILAATDGQVGHINTLIHSAGMCPPTMAPTLGVTAADLKECFEVNAIAPLLIFQALFPLMHTATPPRFIAISSSVGSIAGMEPMPAGAYGPSKAALNYLVKSLHVQMEVSGLVSVALHPGFVQTDMGRFAASEWEFDAGPPLTVDMSVAGMVKVIDGVTRKEGSGKFLGYDGSELPW
jgi:NAD(P)-dependent dehydrogenase (short-subunit alcohol dehydrogenase family)